MILSPDTVSVAIRATAWLSLFQALGAVLFTAIVGGFSRETNAAIQRCIKYSALAGAGLILLHLSLEATRMTGDYSGFVDKSMQSMVWHSADAESHLLQVMGVIVFLVTRVRWPRTGAIIGAACIVSGFIVVGHAASHPWRLLLMPLLAIHVLVAAFWFGSLLPLWLIVRREQTSVACNVLQRFSAIALFTVPLIAIAGVVMALALADGMPSLTQPYWTILLAKGIGYCLLMVLAALNKWLLVPAMMRQSTRSCTFLQQSLMAEISFITAVLSLTAVLTTFYSPDGS